MTDYKKQYLKYKNKYLKIQKKCLVVLLAKINNKARKYKRSQNFTYKRRGGSQQSTRTRRC